MSKICSRCNRRRYNNQFYKCTASRDKLAPWCKNCQDTYRKQYRKVNDEKHYRYNRNLSLIRNYGLTLADYEVMLKKQRGKCKICKVKGNYHALGHIRGLNFCVDHCHKTMKVRGLLCSICNRVLGLAKEDIKVLENCIKYLKFHK